MNFSKILFALLFLLTTMGTSAADDGIAINRQVFSMLDLNHPGLEKVKAACVKGDTTKAAVALLEYYRQRTSVKNIDIDLNHVTLSDNDRKMADDALDHVFFAHKGYKPLNYGKDINWRYWPQKDNEVRWQLHRHQWFVPMGKAWRVTGDEKYAREWTLQYMDWIRKNPCVDVTAEQFEMNTAMPKDEAVENARFAWRPLEVSHRLQDQVLQFTLFINAKSFTPAFLTQFLVNYHRHAQYILHHYSAKGNHLLFESQRMFYAGTFFPEFKDARTWQNSGIGNLNREIKKQVYNDGGQFELDPSYHLACINIFLRALQIARANNVVGVIPESYINTVHKMIVFYYNITNPDYTFPCFSDARQGSQAAALRNYRAWHKVFPDDPYITYLATEGAEGSVPDYLSRGFTDTGFFTFRNGWDLSSTVMVVKAGPKGEWHAQPDNGTFCLWFNGKDMFPDTGSYVYEGDAEQNRQRAWFKQSRVHNTMTLDNKNFETTQSKTLLWNADGNVPTLVTENPSYKDFTHRRTVFFVDQKYFVIVDEALGKAEGTVNLHFGLAPVKMDVDTDKHIIRTVANSPRNIFLQCVSTDKAELKEEEGWFSEVYRKKETRPAYSINIAKGEKPVRTVTLIYPEKKDDTVKFTAKIVKADDNRLEVRVSVNREKKDLKWNITTNQ